ncbi:MAG: hypothetical protein ACJ8FY_16315 [Gemmataceae bacterium]
MYRLFIQRSDHTSRWSDPFTSLEEADRWAKLIREDGKVSAVQIVETKEHTACGGCESAGSASDWAA